MSRLSRACLLIAAMIARADAQAPLPPQVPDPSAAPDPTTPTDPTPSDPTPALDPATTDPVPAEASATPHEPRPSDEMIDPSQLPPPELEAPPPSYPRALVARPLVLPRGRSEASIGFGIGHETIDDAGLMYGAVRFSGRAATRLFEPYGGLQLVPLYSADVPRDVEVEVPFLQRVYAGSRLRVTDDFALGVQATVANFGTDRDTYSPTLFVDTKFRTSERGAIRLSAGSTYVRQTQKSAFTDTTLVRQAVTAYAYAGVQLQVTPVLAIEGSVGIGVQRILGEQYGDLTSRSYSYGASMLISVSDAVDVEPFFSGAAAESASSVIGGLAIALH